MKKFQKALALAIVLLTLFSMVAIIGTDTGFGKVEVSRLTLATADGDELSCLLYKPESATPENPAPAVMLAHGGNDMAEQMTSYAIELSRRGYVVITRDATNHHNSDVSTAPHETSRVEAAGYRPMGLRTVLATLQRFTFVDNDHICALGHSLGATNTLSLAIDTQANHEVFLTINLGQNMYGSKDYRDYNFIRTKFDDDQAFLDFINEALTKQARFKDKDYVPSADDQLVTLVTCVSRRVTNKEYTRWILVAKLGDPVGEAEHEFAGFAN